MVRVAINICLVSSGVSFSTYYVVFLNILHKKKSSGVISEERAGYEIGSLCPIHRFDNREHSYGSLMFCLVIQISTCNYVQWPMQAEYYKMRVKNSLHRTTRYFRISARTLAIRRLQSCIDANELETKRYGKQLKKNGGHLARKLLLPCRTSFVNKVSPYF